MIRAIRQFHESSALVSWGATLPGQSLVWLLSAVLLAWLSRYGPEHAGGPLLLIAICVIPLTTAFAAHRRGVLSIASVAALVQHFSLRDLPNLDLYPQQTWGAFLLEWLRIGSQVAAVLACFYAIYRIVRSLAILPEVVQRYPIVFIHLGIWLALLSVPYLRAPTIVSEVLPIVAWRISYLAQFASRGLLGNSKFLDHLFYLWPVYGPNDVPTPVGKGSEFLSRHEAADARGLARSQLAGLKLLFLAVLWSFASLAIDAIVHGRAEVGAMHWIGQHGFHLPELSEMMARNVTSVPLVIGGLYLELIHWSLRIAVYGHIIVGCLRLFGFHVFRHVYRPLLSTSIVEFWGRWSYYYKELLTDFFFFPTFLRSTWAGPRLRLFVAVFAAAAIGNMYFVILWEADLLLSGDVSTMWVRWGSRSVYCVLLAIGIWVSMLRQQRTRRERTVPRQGWPKYRAAFLVCTFYAIAHVWNIEGTGLGPLERLQWLGRVLW